VSIRLDLLIVNFVGGTFTVLTGCGVTVTVAAGSLGGVAVKHGGVGIGGDSSTSSCVIAQPWSFDLEARLMQIVLCQL
jgi:hypothetical protein